MDIYTFKPTCTCRRCARTLVLHTILNSKNVFCILGDNHWVCFVWDGGQCKYKMSAVPWNVLQFWGIGPVCSFLVLAFNVFLPFKYVGGIKCQNLHYIWYIISLLYFSGRNIRPQNDYVLTGKEYITAYFNVSCGNCRWGKILLSPFPLLSFWLCFSKYSCRMPAIQNFNSVSQALVLAKVRF